MLRAVRILNRSLRRDQEVTPLTGLQTTGKRKPIFGIDIGNHRSRLSVFDPITKKPRLVRNIQDNSDFWHSVVAKNGSDLIVGKNAFQMIQNDPTSGVQRVKSLLGQNTVVLQSNQYQPAELVAQIFKAMGQSAAAYLHQNNLNEPMEAYISVPYTFTPQQREELLHAAEIAGLKIVKLVEEPLAILNSTWRLEQNGQYLLGDFGENFRASVMRVFDGQYDVLGHIEDKAIHEAVEQAVLDYVYDKLVKVKPVKYMLKPRASVERMLRPYVQQINENLVTEVETSIIIDEVVIFVSREARALMTHMPLRNIAATLGELMTQSGVLASEFTHTILVGGNSLQYPSSAEAVERETSMATSRTVAPPMSALAMGTALYGAREQGLLQPHFFRDRTVERLGHVVRNTKITKPQSFAEAEGHLRTGSSLPLPVAINFNDVMAKTKVPPLNPLWDESSGKPEFQNLPRKIIEDYKNPVLSLAFAKTPDPFTGTEEYYARVNVQAVADDFKPITVYESLTDKGMIFKKVKWMHPYERLQRAVEYTRPMLKMHIVIDLSATEYVSTAPELPEFETWEEFIQKADLDDKFQINRLLLGRDPNIEKYEKEGKVQLLKYMKEQLKKPYYRQLNRVHDAVQFILGQLEAHDMIAVSMRTKDGLQTLMPFTNSSDIEHVKLFNHILDTFPGDNVDHVSAAKYAHDTYTEEDVEVFNEFRDFLELRTVVLTDTVPAYENLESIKKSLQEAHETKCVNTTFISVSGRKFDSAIVKTIESVRGANYLEFRNIFSEEFRKKYDRSFGAMFLNSVLPRFFDVKVWVDFENYKVDKVYGYDYQVSPYYKDEIKQEAVVDPEGRATAAIMVERDFATRVEGKTPQLYVKTLFGSYHHEREFVEDLDRANWDDQARKRVVRRKVQLEEDPRLFLFKLQKKPTTIERKSTWSYSPYKLTEDNPFGNRELTTFQADYTDTRSEYTVRIQYTDRSGNVRNFTRVNKLTEDFEYEEPGVRKSVLAARYTEMVRRLVHNKHVSLSGRALPEVPSISAQTGITTLTSTQEKQLYDYYLNNPDLDVSYYLPKTPQINEADLPVFTKFSHYYNSEFTRLFNPVEQWYWPHMPLDYNKDNEQISMQFMKNLAFEYNKKKIAQDTKAQKSYVRNRFVDNLPLQPVFDMFMLKNYKPYQVPKFERVLKEIELHREWDRKEVEGSRTHMRLLRIINYLRWNVRYLAAWLRDWKKDFRDNDPAGALAYRVLLQTMQGKLWMRSKNYWAQLLTYQYNYQKQSRKMEAVVKKNDIVRVNNILWSAKTDVDKYIDAVRTMIPEDKRDDVQLNALRQEMDQYIFERMAELDPEITIEAKRNMYEPDPRDYTPEEIDPMEVQKQKEDEEFGDLDRKELPVKIENLPDEVDRLWELASPDRKRDLGDRKKWRIDKPYATYLTDLGLAQKKRQDLLKRKREDEKRRKEKAEMTGNKS